MPNGSGNGLPGSDTAPGATGRQHPRTFLLSLSEQQKSRTMAKQEKTKAKSTGTAARLFAGRKIGETERWIYGFLLLFVSLFFLLAVVSYYFTWSEDQAALREGLSWSAVDNVANHAGKLGAITGSALVGKWFGVFAIGIPVVLLILSLRIMRVRPLFLNRSVRTTLIVMILGLALARLSFRHTLGHLRHGTRRTSGYRRGRLAPFGDRDGRARTAARSLLDTHRGLYQPQHHQGRQPRRFVGSQRGYRPHGENSRPSLQGKGRHTAAGRRGAAA